MSKRPTIKGKGADLFLGETERIKKKIPSLRKGKITFYLSPSLIEKLDKIWLTLRRENKKISKSDIITKGLDNILEDFEKKGPESEISKYLIR
ncbi:hypothetical protein J7J95_03005 [bacterium]|nr:hypothetical protein [bacterium]